MRPDSPIIQQIFTRIQIRINSRAFWKHTPQDPAPGDSDSVGLVWGPASAVCKNSPVIPLKHPDSEKTSYTSAWNNGYIVAVWSCLSSELWLFGFKSFLSKSYSCRHSKESVILTSLSRRARKCIWQCLRLPILFWSGHKAIRPVRSSSLMRFPVFAFVKHWMWQE